MQLLTEQLLRVVGDGPVKGQSRTSLCRGSAPAPWDTRGQQGGWLPGAGDARAESQSMTGVWQLEKVFQERHGQS